MLPLRNAFCKDACCDWMRNWRSNGWAGTKELGTQQCCICIPHPNPPKPKKNTPIYTLPFSKTQKLSKQKWSRFIRVAKISAIIRNSYIYAKQAATNILYVVDVCVCVVCCGSVFCLPLTDACTNVLCDAGSTCDNCDWLLACLPACPARLPACLPACLPAYVCLICLHAGLLA